MKLWIDDFRNPPDDSWVVVRTVKDAIKFMQEYGCPEIISFDHDLGENDRGIDIVKWMVEKDIEMEGKFIPDNFKFYVHSANPIGKRNIEEILNRYLKFRRENG